MEWVEESGFGINLMETCEVCHDQLPASSGVYRPHTPPFSVRTYRHIDNGLPCPCAHGM